MYGSSDAQGLDNAVKVASTVTKLGHPDVHVIDHGIEGLREEGFHYWMDVPKWNDLITKEAAEAKAREEAAKAAAQKK